MSILDEILANTREEVAVRKGLLDPEALRDRARNIGVAPRGFREALRTGERPRIIAEVKRRSPSKGEIRPDFNPAACAKAYARGGAAALSVLTDQKYFGGHLDDLREIRAAVDLPLLRKDFIVDPYQIDEARVVGADAILLIVSALRPEELAQFQDHARELGLDVLVEVHDEAELELALAAGIDLLGINNRNLATFETNLETSERLLRGLAEGLVTVSESGIGSIRDIERLEAAGAHAFLVGESLMRQQDVTKALRVLRGRERELP